MGMLKLIRIRGCWERQAASFGSSVDTTGVRVSGFDSDTNADRETARLADLKSAKRAGEFSSSRR